MTNIARELKELNIGKVEEDVSMSKHTTYRVGGKDCKEKRAARNQSQSFDFETNSTGRNWESRHPCSYFPFDRPFHYSPYPRANLNRDN